MRPMTTIRRATCRANGICQFYLEAGAARSSCYTASPRRASPGVSGYRLFPVTIG